MKKILGSLLLCICVTLAAGAQGINFVKYNNWSELLTQAKAANKFIFINCYIDGGEPCIEMDQHVFPDKQVGDFYNKHFISVSVNMQPPVTGEASKLLQAKADTLDKHFVINGYPNLLYITPEGKIVHQFLGAVSPAGLIELGQDALDPQKQMYTRIDAFKAGKMDTSEMLKFAISIDLLQHNDAKAIATAYVNSKTDEQLLNITDINVIQHIIKDEDRSEKLAKRYLEALTEVQKTEPVNIRVMLYSAYDEQAASKYIEMYVAQSPDDILKEAEHIRLVSHCAIILGTKSKCFRFILNNQVAAEAVFRKPGSLDVVIDGPITKEYIMPLMFHADKSIADTVNWAQLQDTLALKFNSAVAEKNILSAKIIWYGIKKNWPQYTKAIIAFDKVYGANLSANEVNKKVCWPIFEKSNDAEDIKYGISRIAKIVNSPGFDTDEIDTYANLLYKLGEKDKAIEWEKKAIAQSPQQKQLQTTLDKMNSGVPTW